MTIKIICELDKDGGFTAVDRETGISAYAYPTSTHATVARRRPAETAKNMLAKEIECRKWLPAALIPNALRLDREREARLLAKHGYPPINREAAA